MVKKNKVEDVTPKVDLTVKTSMILESEDKDREAKYLARLADIFVSADLVKNTDRDFYDQEVARAKSEEWEHYLRCDGLPHPNRPVEVRTFIAKMRHFDEIESKCALDWTLSVDDRSVLNQNIFRVDKTRPVVELTKDNPGEYYDTNVRMCLDTLKQIDSLLNNDAELDQMSKKHQLAIMDAYTEVQVEIEQILNRLTYRVLQMQDSYMDTVDGKTAKWSFKGYPWEMDLWGLRNVPIRFEHLDVPVMFAEMKATAVDVQIPLSVLSDCITIRSVHTAFDNFSCNAKSFEPAIRQSENFPNAGIVDVLQSVQNEWVMQEELKLETLNNMETRYQEYEEMMRLIAERTEQAARAAKQSNGEKSNIVIPKTPKKAQPVPPGMVPDIYNDFLKLEDEEYAGYLDEIFHPRHLDMREYEINLRECIMLGGIYSILVIRRPEQTQFEKFNIVLHEDGRVLYTMPDVKADVNDRRRSSVSRKSVEDYRASNMKLEDENLPYFIVSLQLPADLCKWSQPQVCQFLSEQEPVGSDNLFPSDFTTQLRANSIVTQSPKQLSIRGSSGISNIFRPSVRSQLRNFRNNKEPEVNAFPFDDFQLQKPLDLVETRKLERLCIPRIISSFKLPRDITDETTEVEAPKSARCRLVKRVDPEETKPQEEVTRELAFEDQNDPERLFPVFPHVDPIGNEAEEPGALFDHTAFGLLTKLDNIKAQYVGRYQQLWNQQEFVEKKKGGKAPIRPAEVVLAEEAPAEKPQTSKTQKTTEPKTRLTIKSQTESVEERNSVHMQDVTHWTTRYIVGASFDQATQRITFKTDRLGIFGLAFKRYEHFPFREWTMQPNEENPDEIILTLDTFHVRIFFYITTQGVRGYVTDLSKAYTAKPVKYLEIQEPISDFSQLRQVFINKNINIFAENDASFYIENGYFSMKHVATEQHTYNIMGLHCKLMKFYRSSWNRLAVRRDIIMNMKIAKDTSEYSEVTLRITPEQTTFVQVSEKCSDDVNAILLSYVETWRNISNFTDLHQAVTSMVFNATEVRNRDSILFHYVTRMLKELRPLSFA